MDFMRIIAYANDVFTEQILQGWKESSGAMPDTA